MIGYLMDFDRLGDRLKKSQERIQGGAKQVRQIAAEAQAKADGARAARETVREEARKRQAASTWCAPAPSRKNSASAALRALIR